METTLVTAGLACVIAGIIGGGLKAWGIEIPALKSTHRQVTLIFFGSLVLLMGCGLKYDWFSSLAKLLNPVKSPALDATEPKSWVQQVQESCSNDNGAPQSISYDVNSYRALDVETRRTDTGNCIDYQVWFTALSAPDPADHITFYHVYVSKVDSDGKQTEDHVLKRAYGHWANGTRISFSVRVPKWYVYDTSKTVHLHVCEGTDKSCNPSGNLIRPEDNR